MQVISLERLNWLLEEAHCSVKLRSKDGTECDVSQSISIYFNENDIEDPKNGQVSYVGYDVYINEKNKSYKSYKTLIKALTALQMIDGESVSLLSINDNFDTVEDYVSDVEFNNLDMKGLIEKYATADSFELVLPYGNNYSMQNPLGTVALKEEHGKESIKILENEFMQKIASAYANLSEEQKQSLPKYDELIKDITEEINAQIKKAKGKMVFMCDRVSQGKTKYAQPIEFFWHAYFNLQFIIDRKAEVIKMQDLPDKIPLDLELDDKNNKPLKDNLISITPTFVTHCTTSGALSKVFKFKLNDATKQWLMRFKDDYNIEGFEDLAFYKGEKLLFSSCTHEGFHSDYSNL